MDIIIPEVSRFVHLVNFLNYHLTNRTKNKHFFLLQLRKTDNFCTCNNALRKQVTTTLSTHPTMNRKNYVAYDTHVIRRTEYIFSCKFYLEIISTIQ